MSEWKALNHMENTQVNMKPLLLPALVSLLTVGAVPATAEDCREERQLALRLGGLLGTLSTSCIHLESEWIKEEFEDERLDAIRKGLIRFNETEEVSDEVKRDIFKKLDNEVLSKCAALIKELGYND